LPNIVCNKVTKDEVGVECIMYELCKISVGRLAGKRELGRPKVLK
jgi:hypothetical protein